MRPLLQAAAVLVLAASAAAQKPEIPEDVDPETTDSGLTYSVLQKGDPGTHPGPKDWVKVHYTGWLTDGKVFDSSRQRGQPATFPLYGVITGWREGLQLMSEGSRFKLTIPPDLAYGKKGRPGIPPDSTLVFDVELLEVVARAPEFPEARPDKTTTTDSGLSYEVIEKGEGEVPADQDVVAFSFAIWKKDGEVVQHSGPNRSRTTLSGMRVPFIKEVLALMRPGARYRVEVPASAQGDLRNLPADQPTVWTLTVHEITRMPEFSMPSEDDLESTESGLKYQVIKEGEGRKPGDASRVTVHYAGWLEDGTLFDSSYSRGKPSTFDLDGTVKGFQEGLKLMQEGAVYKLVIPAELGYGERGSGRIPGGATLVFLVELKKIEENEDG